MREFSEIYNNKVYMDDFELDLQLLHFLKDELFVD